MSGVLGLVCNDGHKWRKWDEERRGGICVKNCPITVPVEFHPDHRRRRRAAGKAVSTAPEPEPDTDTPAQPARVLTVSSVQAEAITWLWPGRIPRAKKAVIDGDPGTGKSTLTLDLIARLTTGRELPDGTHGDLDGPIDCLLLSAEDGVADTIRPRLEAAGADLDRVHVLAGIQEEAGERLPSLADVDLIRETILRYRVALVVVDPLMAFLPPGTNSHRDQDIRRLLAPLTAMCEQTGATLLLVRHLNKASGGQAIYRGGGSIGIVGDARAGLLVGKDPDDDTRRILAVTKSNLAVEAPALAYRLADTGSGVARIAWEGVTGHTAQQLVAVPADPEESSARAEAKVFLRQMLADGAVSAALVKREARAAGIAQPTLNRAKRDLGITTEKIGYEAGWVWSLPSKGITSTEGDHPHECDPLRDRVIPFGVAPAMEPPACPGCGGPGSPGRRDSRCYGCI